MGDKQHVFAALVLLSSAAAGPLTTAEEAPVGQAVAAGELADHSLYQPVEPVHTGCQRHTVVWSGGVARRGPDRIRPRPVRSRWQAADHKRIFCAGGDPYRRTRVADQPWIR